mmetsp:Transcript_18015/g.33817  ORF Transcript_18015/g.33817 Transcript_18015/m.33817 type:complete len:446 (+) Transcript_18015:82-1419(+)
MPAPDDGQDGFKLFVGSLPPDCTQEELHSVFSTYGIVTHVHVMNPHPKSGQRCAFVFYTTKSAGDDACKVLDNQYRIRRDAEHPIVVRWSKDSGYDQSSSKGFAGEQDDSQPKRVEPPMDGHKLFVGGLPHDVTESELRLVFDTYGDVMHCHVMGVHPKSGQRCAFVYYKSENAAQDAIKVLDSIYKIREDALEPIQVRWANKESQKASTQGEKTKGASKGANKGEWPLSQRHDSWSNGKGGDYWTKGRSDPLGKGSSKGSKDKGKSWSGWEAPSAWGSSWQDDEWYDWGKGWDKGSGWGRGWDDGKGATNWQGDSWSGGGWGYRDSGKGRGGKDGKGWKGGAYMEPSLDPNGTKLYVANLPEDIQEKTVSWVFSTYGEVEKVYLMTGKARNGCISAFVEYGDAEEASSAIMSLDQKYEIRAGYGPLQVRLANATGPGKGQGKSY